MSDKTDWWRGAVIYQIYPRSFMDSNGDGVGDLPGIFQKLEHVAKLGVDAVWISPFFKSPMKDFGYDVSDYRDIEPVFGGLADFKKVVDHAHGFGLKVLIDQVWSHSSDQHDWFKESRQNRTNAKQDWYIWADPKPDGTPPNNWMSWFGGPAWTWDARRMQYYLHHFLSSQPSLNLWSPEVRQAIKHIAAFWLDMGVDGFRHDVASYYLCDKQLRDNPIRGADEPIPTDGPASNPTVRFQKRERSVCQPENLDLIEDIRAFVDQWPDRCLLGEAAGEDSEKLAATYTQTGKRFHLAYSFGLLGSDMTKEPVLHAVKRVQDVIGDGWTCWAVSNHDFTRVVSRMRGNAPLADKAMFATALGMSLRGSYCMYQGEELGLPQAELAFEDLVDPYDIALYPEHVGRDGCRTPMPWVKSVPQAGFSTAGRTWLPVSPEHIPLAADAQAGSIHAPLESMRAFIAWRKTMPAMCLGDMEILDAPDPVMAFRRFDATQNIIALFNCSDRETAIDAAIIAGAPRLAAPSRHVTVRGDKILFKPFGYGFFAKS